MGSHTTHHTHAHWLLTSAMCSPFQPSTGQPYSMDLHATHHPCTLAPHISNVLTLPAIHGPAIQHGLHATPPTHTFTSALYPPFQPAIQHGFTAHPRTLAPHISNVLTLPAIHRPAIQHGLHATPPTHTFTSAFYPPFQPAIQHGFARHTPPMHTGALTSAMCLPFQPSTGQPYSMEAGGSTSRMLPLRSTVTLTRLSSMISVVGTLRTCDPRKCVNQ